MSDLDTAPAHEPNYIPEDAGASPSGGGAVPNPPAQDMSVEDSVRAAFNEVQDAGKNAESSDPEAEGDAAEEAKGEKEEKPKAEEKPAVEKPEKGVKEDGEEEKPAKPERSEKGRFAPREPKADGEQPGRYNAPEKFNIDSKEVWRNVPRAVQRDIDIMVREHSAEIERSREAVERYTPIKQYDDLARQNGRDLSYSLNRVHQIETAMQQNPISALEMILQDAGPRKADGSHVTLMDVARFVMQQDPQAIQQQIAQGMPQQPSQAEVQLAQARQENHRLQAEMMEQSVIAPFKASHPRYAELEGHIANFLHSDMVPHNLNPIERLELAYTFAERLIPPSGRANEAQPGLEQAARAVDDDFSGSKSLKSTPGAVHADAQYDGPSDIASIVAQEFNKRKR